MKKIYQTPETVVVRCAMTQAILQTSNLEMDTDTEIGGQIDDDDRLVKRGRGGDVWDDDWSR